MLQVTPAGSASVRLAFSAVPVPVALLLLTVIVKPMGSPALTGLASAIFVIDRAGHSTFSDADALSEPSLVEVTIAVLS